MADFLAVQATRRTERGSRAARRLRRAGMLPGVVYGHKEETLSLCVPTQAMQQAIRQGTRVVDLQLGGKAEKCLIREIQWDSLGREMVHVDFTRVSVDERIKVTVPIALRGAAPGVAAGGQMQQALHTLNVECLALSVPDAIRVNVGELQLDQAIHVKDLRLPEGVKVLDDPEAVVVQVVQVQEEAAPTAPAEGPVEPELIRKEKREEEAVE